MKKRDRLLKFIFQPPMWLNIIVWICGAVLISASITLYFLGVGGELWALSVHLPAAVFLILSIYTFLALVGVPQKIGGSKKAQQFFSSYNTRAFVYATGSILFNLGYVAFGVIISILTRSIWLAALVGYHVFLILPRVIVLYVAKVRGRADGADEEKQQLRAYTYCGMALVMLAFAVLPVIRLILNDRNEYNYLVSPLVYVLAIATYTFIKFGISVYNMKKARRQDDISLVAVKNVSFVDALISLYALQAMMFKVFRPEDVASDSLAAVLNPVTGGIIALIISGIGVHMIASGLRRLKKYNAESESGEQSGDEPQAITELAATGESEQNGETENAVVSEYSDADTP